MKQPLLGAVASSSDPTEISNRVKGIVLALSGVIIFVAGNFFNITLNPQDIVDLATSFAMIAGAIWTIWGALLAVIRKFATVS